MPILLAVFLAIPLFSITLAYAEPTNRISREIGCEKGQLWVEDRLRFGEDFASGDPALNDLFEASRSGRTNVLEELRALLEPDNLSIEHYDCRFHDGYVQLHVRSKIVLNDKG